MTMKMKLAAVATVALALLCSLPAQASTVTIGVGNPPVEIAGPVDGIPLVTTVNSAPFINTGIITGNPPLPLPQLLNSAVIYSAEGPGTEDLWVTAQGNIPVGPSFETSLTTNSLPPGWTVETKTWIGPDDTAFGTGTLIGDTTFTAPGNSTVVQLAGASPDNPYSITAEYIITATSAGAANTTIIVASAPEPSSVLLLGMGLLGLGFSLRRKHR